MGETAGAVKNENLDKRDYRTEWTRKRGAEGGVENGPENEGWREASVKGEKEEMRGNSHGVMRRNAEKVS